MSTRKPTRQIAWLAASIAALLAGNSSLSAAEPIRLWIDSTGEHRTGAKLLSVSGDTVSLQKLDETKVSVALGKLSENGVRYVREYQMRTHLKRLETPSDWQRLSVKE